DDGDDKTAHPVEQGSGRRAEETDEETDKESGGQPSKGPARKQLVFGHGSHHGTTTWAFGRESSTISPYAGDMDAAGVVPDWVQIPSLRLLVALADSGSVGAAARRIGMAQPNA